jgi:hypothetical protein
MEEKRSGPIYLVCRLISAADEEYATRAACNLVREKLTLLATACRNQIGECSAASGSSD